jgi:hypothetical protein
MPGEGYNEGHKRENAQIAWDFPLSAFVDTVGVVGSIPTTHTISSRRLSERLAAKLEGEAHAFLPIGNVDAQ